MEILISNTHVRPIRRLGLDQFVLSVLFHLGKSLSMAKESHADL